MAMNPERRAQSRRMVGVIDQAVAPLRAWIAQEKNRYIIKAAEEYRRTGHFSDANFFDHEKRILSLLYNQYLKVGRAMNGEVVAMVKAARPALELKAQTRFEYLLKRWAATEAARKAKPIAGTTRDDINQAVQNAFASEAAELIVIRDILATRAYSPWRADAIARTETHNAAMYASITTAEDFAQEESVTMLKVWSPTQDERTRTLEKNQAGHAEMEDAPAIGLADLFQVPRPDGGVDQMDRPGDPSAPANQVINCRCVLTYVVQ